MMSLFFTVQLPMVLQLLHYRIRSVHVGEEGWIKRLAALMDRFYQEETVTEIRTAALTQLEEMVCDHGLPYEAELMDNVVLPLFAVVSDEEDSDVRCRVVQLLLKLLGQCGAQWVTSLLSYINSVSYSSTVTPLCVCVCVCVCVYVCICVCV